MTTSSKVAKRIVVKIYSQTIHALIFLEKSLEWDNFLPDEDSIFP